MTLTNLVNSAIRIGDGVQTTFTFPFSAVRAADVLVDFIGTTGIRTPMNPLHYVVTVGETSGSVLIAAPNIVPNLQKIYIYRKTAATQETDISRQTSYDPIVVGAVWDKLTMLIQDALTEIALAVRVGPETDPNEVLALLDSSVAAAEQDAADAEAAAIAAAASAVQAATFNPALYLAKADNLTGLGNVLTALTSGLGFSSYMAGLRGTANLSALWAALGLGTIAARSSLLFSDIAPTAVRLSSEGYAAQPDDELATAAWAKGYADRQAFGIGQSYTSGGGRLLNTAYQNTTNKPIMLFAYSTNQTTYAFQIDISYDGTNWNIAFIRPSTAFIAGTSLSENLIIPPGVYYRIQVTSGTAPSFIWWELR